MIQAANQGIVGVFAADTATAWVDAKGVTHASLAATSSYQTCAIAPNIGRTGKALITVHAAFAGGMTTWTLMARIKRTADTSLTWKATEIMLERINGATTAAIENALVVANFQGADGVAGGIDVAFVTTSEALGGTLELRVKGNQAAAAGDLFYVAVDAGS